mgnify:CR=1 FL=1
MIECGCYALSALPVLIRRRNSHYRVPNIRKSNLGAPTGVDFLILLSRGVFGQQFDPLAFERFSKFATKIAKITGKE